MERNGKARKGARKMNEYKLHTTNSKPAELNDDDFIECLFSDDRKCTGQAKYFMWASQDECFRPLKYTTK